MLTRIKTSPVPFFGAVQAVWLAVLTLASAFGWWEWSDVQEAAVSGLWLAATGLVTWLLTGKTDYAVTPVINPKDNEGHVLVPVPPTE